ncbi:MAG: hypothetical protein HKN41_07895 [Ilumatobacter sp.]|nr:hypothetical protein [Ilumatobacter sp.]
MRKRTPVIVTAVALASLVLPTSAEARGGPPTAVVTEVSSGQDVVPFVGCSGEVEGIVAIDFRDVFHITEFEDGVSVTVNNQGSFDYVPFDGVPSSGHYRNGFHFSANANAVVDHSVFTGAGVDDDGVHENFHVRTHFTWANGEVRVDYSAGCD